MGILIQTKPSNIKILNDPVIKIVKSLKCQFEEDIEQPSSRNFFELI